MRSVSSFSLSRKELFTCLNFTDWIIFSMSFSKSFNSSMGGGFLEQDMQLPTKEHMPPRRKLPAIISNLPSHRPTRKDNNTTETYIGLTENDFKTRYRNHTASFRHAKHRNSTELSKHIWTLKHNNIEHFISWRILASHSPYNSSSKRCNLCLKEKLLITCRPELSTLNKRNELVSSCRHRNKTLLRNN